MTRPRRLQNKEKLLVGVVCAFGVAGAAWLLTSRVAKERHPGVEGARDAASASADPVSPRAPDAVTRLRLDALISSLEQQLPKLASNLPHADWYLMRAFGPRTTSGALTRLRAQLGSQWQPAPAEAGTEPEWALLAALLESEAPKAPFPIASSPGFSGLPTESPSTTLPLRALAWRLEVLGLLTLKRHSPNPARALARHFELALRRLSVPQALTSPEAVVLCQSIFRVAPMVVGSNLEPRVRRLFGKLHQTPLGSAPAKLSELAQKLEAYGSYHQTVPANTAVQTRVVKLTSRFVVALTKAQEQRLTLRQSVMALRALRLARSAHTAY